MDIRGDARPRQEAPGHTTIATTLNIYSHVIPGLQAESLSFMDGLFASG